MDRLSTFRSYANHAWLKKAFKQLSLNDINLIESFINSNSSLSKDDFELLVNRMFIDKDKPKNWTRITELLICANSIA